VICQEVEILGERPRLTILVRCQDLVTPGEILGDVTHIACHEYRTLVRDQVLSFGVPREVVPLWFGASNHKREMLVLLYFVLYV
jgi:hypothetical protein